MTKTSIVKQADTHIGRVMPQFNTVLAVRCNLCGAALYVNINNVDADSATATLQAGLDTWKRSGRTEHRCRKEQVIAGVRSE